MPKIYRKLGHILLAVGLLLSMFVWPETASACSCWVPDNPADGFSRADAVFVGVPYASDRSFRHSVWLALPNSVVNALPEVIERQRNRAYLLSAGSATRYTFQVDRAWKGLEEPEIEILTLSVFGGCGEYFSLGNTYLVYAQLYENELMTSICHRTGSINSPDVQQDLAFLENMPSVVFQHRTQNVLWLVVGLIGLALFAVWFYSRKRPGTLPTLTPDKDG